MFWCENVFQALKRNSSLRPTGKANPLDLCSVYIPQLKRLEGSLSVSHPAVNFVIVSDVCLSGGWERRRLVWSGLASVSPVTNTALRRGRPVLQKENVWEPSSQNHQCYSADFLILSHYKLVLLTHVFLREVGGFLIYLLVNCIHLLWFTPLSPLKNPQEQITLPLHFPPSLPPPVPPPDFLSTPRWSMPGCGSHKTAPATPQLLFTPFLLPTTSKKTV